MKKNFLKTMIGVVAIVSCLMSVAHMGANAKTVESVDNSVSSYSYYEYYTVDHPGYYSVEPITKHIKNPDMPIYDAFGNILYFQEMPETVVTVYEDVWHPGWTENKCRKITVKYEKQADKPVYDCYGNILYFQEQPDKEVVKSEEVY